MKWISLSAFYDTGKLVFVDPPTDAPEIFHEIECGYNYISEKYTDHTFSSTHLTHFVKHKALISRLNQRPYTAYPYSLSLSRAPPVHFSS